MDNMGHHQTLQRIRAVKWLLPSGMLLLCILTAAGIALAFISGIARLEPDWIFNIGVDIFGVAICTVLFYGCVSGKDRAEETTYYFVALLSANGFALFLDECAWLVQGVPGLRVWNLLVNALFYGNGLVIVYQFWRYIRATLKLDGKWTHLATVILQIALIPATILCYVNLFVPLYFRVDASGVYSRGALYPLGYLYVIFGMIAVITGLFQSGATKRQKGVVISFVAIPFVNAVMTINTFGISTQYVATLVSIVLIYSVLFSERSKALASKQSELHTATQIQESMLPNRFPAFPERPEFDIYASMDPAKEVGGDFYDFFLIDEDHLCMVMADVSGKGVPAALFMMASRIILANNAKMGKSPAQVLTDTNASICSRNPEEMFVTVWLGILELSTGKLTAANAGHEFPVLKKPGGVFELIKDKHGFVIGGMEGMKYKEYTLELEPGAKLFLYTDGVPEATDAHNALFGTERMLAALNRCPEGSPEELLKTVRRAVDRFVREAEQFDDLTMLSLEYRGTKENQGG